MLDRTQNNIEVFEDTAKMITEESFLHEAIKNSISNEQLYLQEKKHTFSLNDRRKIPTQITVSKKRSLEAASSYAKAGRRVCVLNFASATNPGGGVINGASAQEECLCRCSTLYPCLDTVYLWNEFYKPHRAARNALYNDDCIYTPDVYVVKTDTDMPKRLEEKDWYKVDVLTCAAPNLRNTPGNRSNPESGKSAVTVKRDKLREILYSRIKRIYRVAMTNKADVLVLGAFGCGAFRNPPKLVAEVFKKVTEEYKFYFDAVEFAVFCRKHETENYDAFNEVYNGI